MDVERNGRCSSAGNPTGWMAMAKIIRDIDEEKVKDYKEDIDTLLVFSGLFSAILTAFVVESYQNLSPDKLDTVIELLSQISTQLSGYMVAAGTINTTITSPGQPSPAFEPSLAAVYVNQLWFASLIITLITASFAMLVKQWLREYLAMDYTSPHERLRARQFRHPGLAAWKVYEIAGVLPLLLQLALGLFLLGLCFFTWSAHAGLGQTNTILVAGWALLFACATIAPIFTPRCPYKTALLKRGILILRKRVAQLLYLAARHRPRQTTSRHFVEEADAVKLDTDELAILSEADSALMDDELLGTTFLDSLMQNSLDPSTIIQFVFQALNLRLQGSRLSQPLLSAPDLRRLSKRGWIAVLDIVAVAVLNTPLKQTTEVAKGWLQDAIYLLLSISDQPLTSSARNALVHCVQPSTISCFKDALDSCASSPAAKNRVLDILDPLSTHLTQLLSRNDIQPSEVVALVVKLISIDLQQSSLAIPLLSTVDLRPLSEPVWRFSSNTLAAAIQHFLSPAHAAGGWRPWIEDAIHVLLSPSSSQLTSSGLRVIADLVQEKEIYHHFGRCVRRLVSPGNEHFVHTLPRLQQICKLLDDNSDMRWLLKEILYGIPCTSRCTHSSTPHNPSLAHLVYDHTPGHHQWTQAFMPIMIERVNLFLTGKTLWPPGSGDCLVALMCLPTSSHSVNTEIPKLLFPIICDAKRSLFALERLLSVDPNERSRSVEHAAVACVESLITSANKEGHEKFISAMRSNCRSYLSSSMRDTSRHFAECNMIRFLALVNKLHVALQANSYLFDHWKALYASCAEALSFFRTWKYPVLPNEEKTQTIRIAEVCLGVLENMEPAEGDLDEWESTFDPRTSVFPDAIFEEMARFVADEVAIRFKRIRRLRKNHLSLQARSVASRNEASSDE